MSFPVSYLPTEGGAEFLMEHSPSLKAGREISALVHQKGGFTQQSFSEVVERYLQEMGLVATRAEEDFAGQIAKIQIVAYGGSASEVEATLLAYGTRCDAASQSAEVAYGECVIERNLDKEWGETWSWRGRISLTPRWPALG